MSEETIIQRDHPTLRQTAEAVSAAEFGTPDLAALIERMKVALAACEDGVALAAPQINVSKRLFIVSPKIFETESESGPLIFINPELSKTSRGKQELDEGCLSVRWLYGKVRRADKATVTAQDSQGRKFTHHASGLLAQIFQHEIDHLNGVLFIDKASNLEVIKPETDHA